MSREELTKDEQEFLRLVAKLTPEEKHELLELMENLRKRSEKKEA